jgi:16S rRNA (uracil1498-N3)-methyltransferase
MADRFYTPQPLGAGSFVLDGPEAHHLAVVRRFVPGDRVVLFNGDGKEYSALILAADKRSVLLDVHSGTDAARELPIRVEIASALPKGDRADFLVEKLTELGVAKFTPLVTTRAVVLPKDGRVERFQRAVVEASKQSGRAVLMEVGSPAAWAEYVKASWLPPERWVLHPGGTEPYPPAFPTKSGHDRPGIVVAIGPEGGFTDEELAMATAAGWRVVSFGPRVLRVETAAIAAAAGLAVNNPAGPTSPARP